MLGVAYKPDIGDLRESPALKLISLLKNAGADLAYHDPYVSRIEEQGIELSSVPYEPESYDCVVIVTDHSCPGRLSAVGRRARHSSSTSVTRPSPRVRGGAHVFKL